MILLIGGAFQGKTALALEKLNGSPTWILGEETAWQGEGQIVSHLERFIRREMEAGRDPKEEVKDLLERSDPRVVIADEIGCGLVPIDPFERAWREETGRILCALAREAEAVVRVHCGFPQAIKGEWR